MSITRDERQQIFIDKFIKAGGKGTLEAATAFGKTRVALKIIQYLRREISDRKVIIVVPHDYLKKQWEGLLSEWGVNSNSSVHIINSYIKSKHTTSLLILDECHRFAAETFSKVFELTDYKFILGLTAMIKRLDKRHPIITKHCPVIDRVTLEEARLSGFIAPYVEFNLGIEMNAQDAKDYSDAQDYYNSIMGVFQWDFGMLRRAAVSFKPYYTPAGYRGSFCEELARKYGWKGNSAMEAFNLMTAGAKDFWGGNSSHPYHPQKLYLKAITGMRLMRKIKDTIYKYPAKIDAAVEVINAFPDLKAITFAELTETADEMSAKTVDSVSYHSSMSVIDDKGKKLSKKKARDYIINKVNEGKIKSIHTAKALDEGADFPEIALGIRISGSSSPTQQTQRRGRVVRKHADKQAVMVNIYLKNTKEVQWLSKAQGHAEDIIWVDNVQEITNYLYDKPEDN
jgi:superfamily II DNA or RNA helicase